MKNALKILQYKTKDGKPYWLTRYESKFYFVISGDISLKDCKPCVTLNGTPGIIYYGAFKVDSDDTIYIGTNPNTQ